MPFSGILYLLFFLVLILAPLAVWMLGTWLRIYRHLHYYQLEEYKGNRYLRWIVSKPARALPLRPVAVALLTIAVLYFLDWIGIAEGGRAILLSVPLALIGSLIAAWPARKGEVKKPFNRTPRATRILITACILTGLMLATPPALFVLDRIIPGAADFILNPLQAFSRFAEDTLLSYLFYVDPVTFIYAGIVGFGLLAFLLTPLFLVLANALMTPVERTIRQRFIAQARDVMEQIHPKVIGITGSYGKTTTKNFIADILNGRYKAYPTPKSYNTLMGVSIAINRDLANNYAVDYFIVEMGAYVRGEIQQIAGLTPPEIGVIVEVGPQHLERFGTLENIMTAKYELIKALPPNGTGIFNWDNAYVRQMYEKGYPQTRIAVSRTASPDEALPNGPRFIASEITETLDGLTFKVTDMQTGMSEIFQTAVPGEHNVTNILLATAVAVHEGMALREIAYLVQRLKPSESRLVRRQISPGITVINDAYSANPAGVVSALKALSLHTSGRRVLITPGMVELGPLHEAENRKLGEAAAQAATDVILVGKEQTRPVSDGLRAAGFAAERLQIVDKLSEAVQWYQHNLHAGDTVLFLNDLPDTY
jgi:UDP-N-acetylmuramoyl-tripeptide--D-alanyl-D-alanine ligase